MKTVRDVKKGEIVEFIDVDLVSIGKNISLSKNKRKPDTFLGISFCEMCGRALSTSNDGEDLNKLPMFKNFSDEKSGSGSSTYESYSSNYYCSSKCENGRGTLYIIDEDCDGTRLFFERISRRRTSLDDVALYLAAVMYRKLLIGEGNEKCRKIYESSQHIVGTDIDERVMECWVVLRSEIDVVELDAEQRDIANVSVFNSMVRFIRQQCLHQISISHPLIHYIEDKFLKLSDSELELSLKMLENIIPRMKYDDSDKLQVSDKVMRWRNAVRLVQALTASVLENDEVVSSMFDKNTIKFLANLRRSYYVFCPFINLEHSCVPNSIVQGVDDAASSGNGPVKVALVALHDIKKSHDITISYINDLSANVDERQVQLRQIYGPRYKCKCVRCRCENQWAKRKTFKIHEMRGHDIRNGHYSCKDLKMMGDLAMQNSQFIRAGELYRMVLKVQAKNGDVLHALSASLLERGNIKEAHEMWKQANKVCPDHEGISLHVKKKRAYKQNHADILDSGTPSAWEGLYTTLIPFKAFVTRKDNPIITLTECNQAIQWAEAAAKSRRDGWTTSRHYDVPTTDIPLHEIPPLLEWFNGVLGSRLRPLLAMQFGTEEVGIGGSNVFIHDAFIVRYDANGGQKHLPLHRDQSTHSFTIALNSMSEYDGGGTYVASLKRAVRLQIGGALSFRGDQLLHGGDPVVEGRRYIIVAFCYVSKPSSSKSHDAAKKKIKLDGIFKTAKPEKNDGDPKQTSEGGFSFSFQC